jgi:hypothetical protein
VVVAVDRMAKKVVIYILMDPCYKACFVDLQLFGYFYGWWMRRIDNKAKRNCQLELSLAKICGGGCHVTQFKRKKGFNSDIIGELAHRKSAP